MSQMSEKVQQLRDTLRHLAIAKEGSRYEPNGDIKPKGMTDQQFHFPISDRPVDSTFETYMVRSSIVGLDVHNCQALEEFASRATEQPVEFAKRTYHGGHLAKVKRWRGVKYTLPDGEWILVLHQVYRRDSARAHVLGGGQ